MVISIAGTRKVGINMRVPCSSTLATFRGRVLRRLAFAATRRRAVCVAWAPGSSSRPMVTILTNAHVVDGADEVTVADRQTREFKAKVLRLDKSSDVAVLRSTPGSPVVKTGNAGNTRCR